MNDRTLILNLTQVAFLNALILSLLGIQFIFPFASVVLLIIVPVVFALQIYHRAIKISILSGLLVVLLSSILFGVIMGLWTLVYLILGIALGLGFQYRIPLGLRFGLVGSLFSVSLAIIILVLGWLAGINVLDITAMLSRYGLSNRVPLAVLIGIGLIGWAFMTALGSDRILSRVLSQIDWVE